MKMKRISCAASLLVLAAAFVALILTVAGSQSYNPLSEFGPGEYEIVFAKNGKTQEIPGCNSKDLHRFHYTCEDDDDEVEGMRICTNTINKTVEIKCNVHEGVQCQGNHTFYIEKSNCIWTNGYKFETAMILATLLGIFGIDRCYLGYITLGIFKFISCGGFIVWTLLDIILIASQILGPADGSSYEFISNVPRIRKLNIYNSTYWMP